VSEPLDDRNGDAPPGSHVVAVGLRRTRQQRAVGAALEELEEFTSAQQLYERLSATGARVGIATIYNQLRTLVRRGQLDSVRSRSGEVLYRRCRTLSDHYRLVCRQCGKVCQLHAPEVELWAQGVAKEPASASSARASSSRASATAVDAAGTASDAPSEPSRLRRDDNDDDGQPLDIT
jgi:Fur family ferric uptake transcriptional regulator